MEMGFKLTGQRYNLSSEEAFGRLLQNLISYSLVVGEW